MICRIILSAAEMTRGVGGGTQGLQRSINFMALSAKKLMKALTPVVAKMSDENKRWLAQSGAFENAAVLTKLYSMGRLASRRPK